VVAVLVIVALVVQTLVAFRFFLYCDENLRPGTARETVCQIADQGGYLAAIVLPAASVLIAGVFAVRRRRRAVIVAGFAVAMLIGIAVPLTTALVAGYR
jgi:MFS family permease